MQTHENGAVDYSDLEFSTVIQSFKAYNFAHKAKLNKEISFTEDYCGPFLQDAFNGMYLFRQLETIIDRWSPELKINFSLLSKIFQSYIQDHPKEMEEAFEMQNILIELISDILQRKEFIRDQLAFYDLAIEIQDSSNSKGQPNEDILLEKIKLHKEL